MDDLSDKLLSLARMLVEEINLVKVNGELVREERPYVRMTVGILDVKDGEITSFSQGAEDIVRSEFNRRTISQLVRDFIKQLDENEKIICLDCIADICDIKRYDAHGILRQFIEQLVNLILESDDTSDTYLSGLIHIFVDGLEKEPDWTFRIWLNGIWIEQPQIEMVEGAILRQPTPSDFEVEIPSGWAPLYNQDIDNSSVMAVLEITVRESSHIEADAEIINYTNLLRLFRLGQVKRLKHTRSASRLTGSTFFTGITSYGPCHPRYKYEFKPDDVDTFAKYCEHVKPHIAALREKETFIGIAYSRYESASFSARESCITSAISCLEALYLGGNEGQFSHRLSQRTAALLRILTSELGPDIYKQVKDAYGIRSKFVHGSVEGKKDRRKNTRRNNAHNLSVPILNYARQSLLVFLQLKTLGKDDFLQLIDRSLLDYEAHGELVNLLKHIIVT
jgi:hypothetical protein